MSLPQVSFNPRQLSMDEQKIQEFIQRWSNSGGAERANYQLFLSELCDVLQVARPEPTVEDDARNAYVFERNVLFDNLDGTHTTRRIDLYKRGCFVLESKQGVLQHDAAPVLSARQQELRAKRKRGHGTRGTAAWDDAMFRARGQAEQYAAGEDAAETGLGGDDVDGLGPPLFVFPAAVDQRQVGDPAGAFAIVHLAPGVRADAVPPGLQAVQDELFAGELIEQEITEITEDVFLCFLCHLCLKGPRDASTVSAGHGINTRRHWSGG